MINKWTAAGWLLICIPSFAQPTAEVGSSNNVEVHSVYPPVAEKCGMTMQVPHLKNVSEQMIDFECRGDYRYDDYASLTMSFDYDGNFFSRPGDYFGFIVEKTGVDEKIASGKSRIVKINDDGDGLVLAETEAFDIPGCVSVINATITPISGVNWHGWMVERIYGDIQRKCKPVDRNYTSRYRCVQAVLGNEKITAELDQVCLLRKYELGLKNGFSHDLFMNMIKTIRFREE